MANIGTFTADKDGFTGTLRTLTLNVKVKLVPNDSSAAGPPLPGASARGKGGRQDKRTRHRAASKACLHMGGTQHGAASPPCRIRR